ncbi:MAG: NUDIX domain-containing protein [Actinomycetota bacterium]
MGADEVWRGDIRDVRDPSELLGRTSRYEGRVWRVVTDAIRLPDGTEVERDIIVHPGAVGIVALDDDDRVLLIRQYRQPVGGYLFELPAGLRDVVGEHPWATAQRELLEESGYVARDWHVLLDFFNSPGGSTEAFRCYLARGLTEVDGGRPATGEAEEAHLPRVWVDLDAAVDLALRGELHNPTTVTGVLAAASARERGWSTLRPAGDDMWVLPDP